MSFIIACKMNHYGEKYSLSCSLNCKTCRHTDGCSSCKAGWMGSSCTSGNNNSILYIIIKIWHLRFDFLKLKIQIYLYIFCFTSKQWFSIVKACLNSYGENCRYSCSLHCTNQTSDRFNGSCLIGCADGFYGKSCKRCNAGWKTVISMAHFM